MHKKSINLLLKNRLYLGLKNGFLLNKSDLGTSFVDKPDIEFLILVQTFLELIWGIAFSQAALLRIIEPEEKRELIHFITWTLSMIHGFIVFLNGAFKMRIFFDLTSNPISFQLLPEHFRYINSLMTLEERRV